MDPRQHPDRFLLSTQRLAVLHTIPTIIALVLSAHTIYRALRDYLPRRTLLTLCQLMLTLLSALTIVSSGFMYYFLRRPPTSGWQIGAERFAKIAKPCLILTFVGFLLCQQFRYSIVIPNRRKRDITLLAITLTMGTIYFLLSTLESMGLLTAITQAFFLVYSLGYFIFPFYVVIIDNIISIQILRTLLRVKQSLLALSTTPATTYISTSRPSTTRTPRHPLCKKVRF
ncbi:hypothetical protein HK097_005316, partial [Rhizophlyctis rosea]